MNMRRQNQPSGNSLSSIARSQTFPSTGTVGKIVNHFELARFNKDHLTSQAPHCITPGIVKKRIKIFDKVPHIPSTQELGSNLFYYCKGLATSTAFLPRRLRDMLLSREHFSAGKRMVRTTPEKVEGLLGVFTHSSRIKSFSFTEFLNYSYLIDNCYLVLYCLTLGYTMWLSYLTSDITRVMNPMEIANLDELMVYNLASDELSYIDNMVSNLASDEFSSRENPESSIENVITERLLRNFYRDESLKLAHRKWDPLGLPSEKHHKIDTHSLALMLGGIILALLLNESVRLDPEAA